MDNWTEFNISDYYNSWKNGSRANKGIVLVPLNTNNYFNFFQSSSTSTPNGQKPFLRFSKNVVCPSSKIALKWPLSTPFSSRVVTQGFGEDWAGGTTCSATGKIKKHNGVDYSAKAGDPIYAAADGVVKNWFYVYGWGNVITIEHVKPDGTKYTTTYWHVAPISSLYIGQNISKGQKIATVYDLSPEGHATHFHFGIRNGAYYVNNLSKDVSSVGALPQTDCDGWPAFQEMFLNPENNSVFQLQ